MTISVKHAFTSSKGDGSDSTLIRPSNWNAEHTITMATDKVLGRSTAGTGAVEEISCTSTGRSIMAAASVSAILTLLGVSPPTTGDIKLTLKTSADSGWLIFDDGTFGDASSSASQRANADTQDLFYLLFDNLLDANAPLLTSAGAATTRAAQTNKATAWAAHCRMSLPKTLGRALAIAGAGSGLTSRALGVNAGAESVTLTSANIPSLTSTGNNSISVTSTVSILKPQNSNQTSLGPGAGGFASTQLPTYGTLTSTDTNAISVSYTNASPTAVSVMQPSAFLNAMVKL